MRYFRGRALIAALYPFLVWRNDVLCICALALGVRTEKEVED